MRDGLDLVPGKLQSGDAGTGGTATDMAEHGGIHISSVAGHGFLFQDVRGSATQLASFFARLAAEVSLACVVTDDVDALDVWLADRDGDALKDAEEEPETNEDFDEIPESFKNTEAAIGAFAMMDFLVKASSEVGSVAKDGMLVEGQSAGRLAADGSLDTLCSLDQLSAPGCVACGGEAADIRPRRRPKKDKAAAAAKHAEEQARVSVAAVAEKLAKKLVAEEATAAAKHAEEQARVAAAAEAEALAKGLEEKKAAEAAKLAEEQARVAATAEAAALAKKPAEEKATEEAVADCGIQLADVVSKLQHALLQAEAELVNDPGNNSMHGAAEELRRALLMAGATPAR